MVGTMIASIAVGGVLGVWLYTRRHRDMNVLPYLLLGVWLCTRWRWRWRWRRHRWPKHGGHTHESFFKG